MDCFNAGYIFLFSFASLSPQIGLEKLFEVTVALTHL